MTLPLNAESVLTQAGVSINEFITIGHSTDPEIRNTFWRSIEENIVAIDNTGGIPGVFGDGQTLESVASTISAVHSESELTTISNLENNKYANKFKTLKSNHPSILNANLDAADAALRIGFIDVNDNDPFAFQNASLVPSSIVIEESFINQSIDTLRTDTSPVVPSYNSSHTITFDIVFPNIESINSPNGLRGLYAQCRMLPYLTVESPIITAAFINKVVTPQILKLVNQELLTRTPVASEMRRIAEEAKVSISEAIELLRTQDPLLQTVIEDIGEKLYKDIFADGFKPLEDDIDSLTDRAEEDIVLAIPVAFRGVTMQTMPSHPGAILSRWTFTRMHNSSFHNGQMVFRDAIGNPTLDIKKCIYMKKYFNQLLDEDRAGEKFLQKIETDEKGNISKKDEPDFLWADVFGNERSRTLSNFIDTQVTIRMRNKIVELPIIGNFYPTMQHMGRNNTEAHIVYSTTSLKDIQLFNEMKSEVLAEGRKGFLRRNAVQVNHPLLQLFGLKDFAINSISIESNIDNPNLYQVVVQLVENSITVRDAETLRLETSGLSAKLYKAFMDYIYDVYQIIYIDGNDTAFMDSLTDAQRKTMEIVRSMIFDHTGGLFSSFDNKYGPMSAAISRHLFKISNNRAPFSSNVEIDSPLLADKIHNNDTPFLSATDLIEISDLAAPLELALQNNISDSVLLLSIIDIVLTGDTERSFTTIAPKNMSSVSSALAQRFNPRVFVSRQSKSMMPRRFWDSFTEVVGFRNGDESTLELWSDRMITHPYVIIFSILSSDALDQFMNIDGSTVSAKFSRDIFTNQDELTRTNPTKDELIFDSCYPDLDLPTYADLFSEDDSNGTPQLITSDGIAIWERFAPTYSQLGIPPDYTAQDAYRTMSDSRSKIARSINHQVEPSVFYYQRQTKKEISQLFEKNSKYNSLGSMKEYSITLPWSRPDIPRSIIDSESFGQWVYKNILTNRKEPDVILNQAREKAAKLRKLKNNKLIYFITEEGEQIGFMTNPDEGPPKPVFTIAGSPTYVASGNSGTYEMLSEEHSDQLRQSTMDHFEDLEFSMARTYPTIKVYLIEEDREHYLFSDDFYGYSSIIDCNITTDMEDAAVATLKLSNYGGLLSDDLFQTPQIDGGGNESIADEEGEPYFSRFKIKPGTHIQIRMGYTTGRDLLPIVFNGKVAEIQPGEVITLIAQGFKTELFNNVGLFSEKYAFTQDDRPNHRAVMNKILEKAGDTPHLGRKIGVRPGDINSESTKKFMNRIFGSQISRGIFGTGFGGQTGLWYSFFGAEFSDIGRNIWYDTPGYVNPEWITTTKTAWNALKEVARLIPNYIVAVTPYDADATVFVGNPSHLYRYKSPTMHERKQYITHAPMIHRKINNDLDEKIIDSFIASSKFRPRFGAETVSYTTEVQKDFETFRYLSASLTNRLGDSGVLSYHKSLERDFTKQWQYLGKIHTEMQRYAFAKFYGFRFTGEPWPGAMESKWMQFVNSAMGSLRDKNGSLTQAGITIRDFLNNPNDNSVISNHTSFAGSFTGVVSEVADLNENLSLPSSANFASVEIFNNTNGYVDNIQISKHLNTWLSQFRLFVFTFVDWLQSQEESGTIERKKLSKLINNMRAAGLPPGYKTFRDYHIVTSDSDIIQNNIVASESEMWNTVSITTVAGSEGYSFKNWKFAARGIIESDIDSANNLVYMSPSQEKVVFPTSKGLGYDGKEGNSEGILRNFEEPNAHTGSQRVWALAARMAEGLRKMYRGNLIVVGRKIKPWDVVFIRDEENQMYGPILVERATHHFSSETGWVTTIVPNAYTTVNSGLAMKQMSAWEHVAAFLASDTFNNLMWIVTGVSILTGVGAAAGISAKLAQSAVVSAIRNSVTKGVVAKGVTAVVSKTAQNSIVKRTVSAIIGKETFNRAMTMKVIQQAGKLSTVSSSAMFHSMLSVSNIGFTGLSATLPALAMSGAAGVISSFATFQLADDNMPVHVNLLTYRFRSFQAGLQIEKEDLNSFWDNFQLLLDDAGKLVDGLFTGTTNPYKSADNFTDKLGL